jgi:cation diffusion facilitator family transporter
MNSPEKKKVSGKSGGGQCLVSIKRITWIGFASNLLLSGIKFTLGILGRSNALIADAAHSLSDVSTDLVILFGAKYWTAPPDRKHPYGHQRIETLVTMVIGGALIAVGLGIGYEAILTVHEKHIMQPDWLALVGALLSIVCKEILYRCTRSVGRRINSSAVVANAWHNRADAISSVPVAIAILVAMIEPELAYVDSVGALIVCVFILYSSWKIIKPALEEISEAGVSSSAYDKIKEVAYSIKGVKNVHAIRTRKMGQGVLVDLHMEVDADLTVKEGHDIAAMAKFKLMNEGPSLLDVVIHIEPFEPETDD